MSDFQENDEKEKAAKNVSVNPSSSSGDDTENENCPSKKQKHGHPFPESESSHSYEGKSEDPQVQIGDPSVTSSTKTAAPATANPESCQFEKVFGHSRDGETESVFVLTEVQERMKNAMNDSDFEEKEKIAYNPSMVTADKEISETGFRQSSMGKGKDPEVRTDDQLSTSSNEIAVPANPEQGAFLFKKQLCHTDVSGFGLYIPKEDAQKYFPCLEAPPDSAVVQFYDPALEKWWCVMLIHKTNDTYRITNDWQKLVKEHGLVAGDFVLFYEMKNLSVAYQHRYIIRIEKAKEEDADNSPFFGRQSSTGKGKDPQIRTDDQLSISSNEIVVPANPKQGAFLFKKQLSHTDASGYGLYILKEDAQKYFPCLKAPPESFVVQFYDPQLEEWWHATLIHKTNDTYCIANDWQKFVKEHGLVVGDFVLFYEMKNLSVAYQHLYIIRIEKVKKEDAEYYPFFGRQSSTGKGKDPQFRTDNQLNTSSNETAVPANPEQGAFLFKKQLSHTDASGYGLYIPKEEAKKYFPYLKAPPDFSVVQFYDPQLEKWWHAMLIHKTNNTYRITNDWHKFVKEHVLVAGDFVLFYKMKNLSVAYQHRYIIRIEKVKKEDAETSVLNDQSDKPGIGEKNGDGKDGSGGMPSLDGGMPTYSL